MFTVFVRSSNCCAGPVVRRSSTEFDLRRPGPFGSVAGFWRVAGSRTYYPNNVHHGLVG
jgi:hypothetical protein